LWIAAAEDLGGQTLITGLETSIPATLATATAEPVLAAGFGLVTRYDSGAVQYGVVEFSALVWISPGRTLLLVTLPASSGKGLWAVAEEATAEEHSECATSRAFGSQCTS
jgi:hypothetical protein